MEVIISGHSDIGVKRKTNQDSVLVKTLNTPQGTLGFCAMCDGMGGLSEGEIASQASIKAFNVWAETRLPSLCENKLTGEIIRDEWIQVVNTLNENIKAYGKSKDIKLGTTAVVMLVTESEYYVMNIGDSRAYIIANKAIQITRDQTLVAREVEIGNLTPEEALTDPRKHIILQCIGATQRIKPDFFVRPTPNEAVFVLCSDGFYHFINDEELYEAFAPYKMKSDGDLRNSAFNLTETVKMRGETDNITVALIKVEKESGQYCEYANSETETTAEI